MAISSSAGSSSAPIEFQLSSSNEDSSSKTSLIMELCPLCRKLRKKFHCRDCIIRGDFVSSKNATMMERFADIQLLLQTKTSERNQVHDKCEAILSKKIAVDKLKTEIDYYKERIIMLKQLNKEYKEKVKRNNEFAGKMKIINKQRAERLPKYQDKVVTLQKLAEQTDNNVKERKKYLLSVQKELNDIVKIRVQQLNKYIFPLYETIPTSRSEDEDNAEDSISSAIAEASHMAFVRGRWVYGGNSGELHHCIVAPMLPASGDYSAYCMWVAANKDAVPGSSGGEGVEHNPAYTISAALTYTSQFVNVLSFYLDVRLPRKQCYSDFCRLEMTDQQFARRVARLNFNVVHLCFSQNVNSRLLQPLKTLHNITLLLNNDGELGRQGPIQIDPEIAIALEDQISRYLESSEANDETCSEDEEEDVLPGEWEAVPSFPYQESGAGALVVNKSTMDSRGISSTQTASVAGGLVNSAVASVASIWRGWTGTK